MSVCYCGHGESLHYTTSPEGERRCAECQQIEYPDEAPQKRDVVAHDEAVKAAAEAMYGVSTEFHYGKAETAVAAAAPILAAAHGQRVAAAIRAVVDPGWMPNADVSAAYEDAARIAEETP